VCGEWTRREWDERKREREEKEEEKEEGRKEGRKGAKERKGKGKGKGKARETNKRTLTLSHTHSKRELPKRVAKEGGGERRGGFSTKGTRFDPAQIPSEERMLFSSFFFSFSFSLAFAYLLAPRIGMHLHPPVEWSFGWSAGQLNLTG